MASIFDFFQLITTNLWLYGGTFLLVLSILVFVHEWGHYIVARMCGVRVETFSIGFGKELCGFNDKNGTRWKISLIPLGGYVKMFGDTDPASSNSTDKTEDESGRLRSMTESERAVAFFSQPVWKRFLIVLAGPAINFIFAIIIMAALFGSMGQQVTPPLASAVIAGSAAEQAGFEPHDKVIRIDGEKIYRFEDIRRKVMVALDTPMEFTILRDGQEKTITVRPKREVIEDHFGFKHSRGMLGIIGPGNGLMLENIRTVDGKAVNSEEEARKALIASLDQAVEVDLDMGAKTDSITMEPLRDLNPGLFDPQHEDHKFLIVSNQIGEDTIKHGILGSLAVAAKETVVITSSTLEALGQMFMGVRSPTELGGLIRIGAIAGDMAQQGLVDLIMFSALLSINLGLINLFPIPMLDGGHLVFYIVEFFKGSPIPDRVQEYAFQVGLVLLAGLMLFANFNDIVQLIL